VATVRSATDAAPPFARTSQAGDHGEEVARGPAAGLAAGPQPRMPREQWPDKTAGGSTKRLASWVNQLKTGHCLTGQYLKSGREISQLPDAGGARTGRRRGCTFSEPVPTGRPSKDAVGGSVEEDAEVEEPVHDPGPCRYEVLPASTRLPLHHGCGETVPAPAVDDAQSEASEWELRKRREREEEKRVEAKELGAEGEEELPLFLPTSFFMFATAEEE
jgi:hypothetical protein